MENERVDVDVRREEEDYYARMENERAHDMGDHPSDNDDDDETEDEDGDIDYEEGTPQERLVLARDHLKEILDPKYDREHVSIDAYDLLALVLDPVLQKKFMQHLCERNGLDKVTVDFGEMEQAVASLEQDQVLSTIQATLGIGSIGGALGQLSIQSLHLRLYIASDISIATSFVHSCRQTTSLCLDLSWLQHEDDRMDGLEQRLASLRSSLSSHPALVRLEIQKSLWPDDVLRAVCAAAVCIPTLEIFSLEQWKISSREDAELLRNVIQHRQIQYICLQKAHFENAEVANILIEAISASNLLGFDGMDLAVPAGVEADFVDALAGIDAVALRQSIGREMRSLVPALGVRLKHVSSVRKLILDKNWGFRSEPDDFISSFLNEAVGCTLREIDLRVNQWSEVFENALAKFAASSPRLRKLEVYVYRPDGGSIINAFTKIANAMDSGARCLENVILKPATAFHPAWTDRIHFVAGLNRKRRMASPLFTAIRKGKSEFSRAARLRQALEKVGDTGSLFEFFRRGEMGLLPILRCHKVETDDASIVGVSCRKRSIECVD